VEAVQLRATELDVIVPATRPVGTVGNTTGAAAVVTEMESLTAEVFPAASKALTA
jgi:hypothetical protein